MFKKILVPIDVDRPIAAKAVYDCAAELAKKNGAQIKLISVMPGFGMPIVASYITDRVRNEAADHFKEALTKFVKENCDDSVTFHVRSGKNWREIVKMAEKWEADLIILYHNRRREVNEMFSHTCCHNVYQHSPCSVLRLRNIRED